MPAACPRCSGDLRSSFRVGHLQYRITCAGCGARLQGNWVVYVLAAACAILSLSALLVAGLLWEKSRILAYASGGLALGLSVELFRHGSWRWARFFEDED